jgi:glucose/arabinose dehydrogenase/protein-disulfide isomerase
LIRSISGLSRSVIVSCIIIILLLYFADRSWDSKSSGNFDDTFQVLPDPNPPRISDASLKAEKVISGLELPTSMAFLDHDDIVILEKNGKVRLVSNGVLQPNPIFNTVVRNESERGLLGVSIANATDATKTVFLYYTEPDVEGTKNRIYRYEWDGSGNLNNGRLILDLPGEPGPNHDGGKMTIGPDGILYAVIGDLNRNGMLQNHKDGPAADDTSVIFRVDRDGNGVGNALSGTVNLSKYYAYGIRNSFGFDFDPLTGTLWDAEDGPTDYDEINVVTPGFNSGWKEVMGPLERREGKSINDLVQFEGSHYADPVFSLNQSVGITDIEFLNSTRLGEKYAYNIFAADINNGNLYFFTVNSNRTGLDLSGIAGLEDLVADNSEEVNAVTLGTGFLGGITDIETGSDGLLYVLTFNGSLYRISPMSANDRELGQAPAYAGNIGGENNSVVARSNNSNAVNLTDRESYSSSSDNPLSLRSLSGTNGGSPVLGNLDAPVTVVDFSDFQCPRCARYVKSTEPEIKKEYVDTGKVALIFKHFPRLGADSFSAALASECADEQSKFWEYHDILYQNQQGENSGWASKEKLKEFASQIGLDRQQFDSCLDSEKYKSTIDRDLALVEELNLQTTPSFLILRSDGTEMEVLTGPHPFPSFKALIDKKILN